MFFSHYPIENVRTNHKDIKYNFWQNLVYDNIFILQYIRTRSNINSADIYKKSLTRDKMLKFCRIIFGIII